MRIMKVIGSIGMLLLTKLWLLKNQLVEDAHDNMGYGIASTYAKWQLVDEQLPKVLEQKLINYIDYKQELL